MRMAAPMAKKKAVKRRARRDATKGAARAKPPGIEFDHLFLGTSDFNGSWRFWTEVVGLPGRAKWGKPEIGR